MERKPGSFILIFCIIIMLVNTGPILLAESEQKQETQESFEATYGLAWNQTLNYGTSISWASGLEKPDHSIVFVGTSYEPAPYDVLHLWSVTGEGGIQWSSHYSYPERNDQPIPVKGHNEEIIIVFSYNGSVYCWGFDNSGQRVWQTNHSSPGQLIVVRDVCQGGDETILAVGQIRPTGSDMDAFDVWIASFTTAGELLWNRTIPIEEQAENPTTVFENGADQILVVGNWETWEEQYHKGFFSMCIDVNGSLVWDQFYEGEVCLRVVPCNDGGFLMLEIEHFWYWIEGYWVNRFNATGHLLWHRAYDLGYNVIEAFLLKSLSGSSILIGKKEVYESGEYLTEIYGSEFNEAGEVVMKIQIRLPHYQIYLHEMVVCSDGSLMGLGWDARKMACFAFCLKPSFRPTPPLLFSLNLFNPSSAMLVWMPSLDQDGIIDHYHLQLSPYANFSFINSSFDIEGHQWFKANLSSGIGYYRICGIDNLWVMSNWSNIVQVNVASQNRVLTLLSWVTIDVIATVVITISILFVVQKSKRWNPRPLNQEK